MSQAYGISIDTLKLIQKKKQEQEEARAEAASNNEAHKYDK